jgi:glutaminyl-peptide cyclotransferase
LSSDAAAGRRPGIPRRAGPTLALLLLLLLLPAVILSTDGAAQAAVPPPFLGERALQWLRYQCDLGPRVPGTPGIRLLRRALVAHADSLGLSCAELCFTQQDPYGPQQLELCNVIISAGPSQGRHLWLAAHYDTRPRCDRDPDPALRERPLPGANDGASGVAVLLHLAELLAAAPPPRGVDLIFFDGEDYGREGDLAGYCLGSRQLASHWREFGSPLARGEPAGLILLDMVGEKGLTVPQELYSLGQAPDWTESIFRRAAELGLGAFAPRPGRAVYDDHIPFLQVGIRAVDLIDFDFPQWHTTGDVPAVCAAASLEQVGRLVTDIAYRPLDTE